MGFFLHPQVPIQGAILNRFGEMGFLDIGRTFQIGDGAGDFQKSAVSLDRKSQTGHRRFHGLQPGSGFLASEFSRSECKLRVEPIRCRLEITLPSVSGYLR